MSRVLVVDDEQAVCWSLERALKAEGHDVAVAASAEEAFVQAKKLPPDAILLDVRLPGIDGLTALAKLAELSRNAPTIVMTAFGTLPTAVKAVENGAVDYLAKPFDLDQALDAVRRALERRPAPPSAEASADAPAPDEMVGVGSAMQNVFKRIALVAPRASCVLITGESGTGKELAARAIHRFSPRRDRPFLPVHVAALNPNLVESELFGHAKGAFTGAAGPREGLFSLAQGGTLFLDEVAEIPLGVQVKLLRVLEQSEATPVGAGQPEKLDIRIVAATHQDLERLVGEGRFRADLFFRLSVFPIHLPPLRQRREDIVPLAEHFVRRLAPGALPLDPRTAEFLRSQPWLGNVRELRNALEHAVIVANGAALTPDQFPAATTLAGASAPEQLRLAVVRWLNERIGDGPPPRDLYDALLACVEPPLLEDLMRRLGNNRLAAAEWLGLNRATVRKKLAKYGLP